MAMQSNCNGSLTKSNSQKEQWGAEREFEKIQILIFLSRQENVVEPQYVVKDRLITFIM